VRCLFQIETGEVLSKQGYEDWKKEDIPLLSDWFFFHLDDNEKQGEENG
jgi:hypothetical protein